MNFARGPDVEADIYLLPSSEGGRSAPAFSGYRPQHQIRADYQTSGTHQYAQRERLAPGESTRGTITFITPEAYPNSLRAGDVIDILEGSRLVGRATIVRVLNRLLERAG
jgi:elongation factor Tu